MARRLLHLLYQSSVERIAAMKIVAIVALGADDSLWHKVTMPAGEGYTVASSYPNLPSIAPSGAPVLMYHHHIAEGDDKYYVSPKMFEKRVAWLKKHNGLALPAKPIMFTIDDGNPSTATFKEILDKYEYRGVYSLPNYAQQSEEEIRELATLGHGEQYDETMHNKQWLERIMPDAGYKRAFKAWDTFGAVARQEDGVPS